MVHETWDGVHNARCSTESLQSILEDEAVNLERIANRIDRSTSHLLFEENEENDGKANDEDEEHN